MVKPDNFFTCYENSLRCSVETIIRTLRYSDNGLRTTAGRALSFVWSTGLSRVNIES